MNRAKCMGDTVTKKQFIHPPGEPSRNAAKSPPQASGQGLVEYALILALVAVVAIGTMSVLGNGISNAISTVNNSIENSIADAGYLQGSGGSDKPPGSTGVPPTQVPTATPDVPGAPGPEPTDDPGEGGGPLPAEPTDDPPVEPTDDPGEGGGPVVPDPQEPTDLPVLPSATNTTIPPSATYTPTQPTATNTVPPTETNTPVPPTVTNTPKPPTATNTPKPPTPTETPTPITKYVDKFDGNGNMEWVTVAGTWSISGGRYGSSSPDGAVFHPIPFDDYEFEAEVDTINAGSSNNMVTLILFRIENASSFYAVSIRKDGQVVLSKNTSSGWIDSIASRNTSLDHDDENDVRIIAEGKRIQVYVNGTRRINHNDNSNPILSGGIGFANQNSTSRIDDVSIEEID
jgi:Flp pilus assembly pilin Flp